MATKKKTTKKTATQSEAQQKALESPEVKKTTANVFNYADLESGKVEIPGSHSHKGISGDWRELARTLLEPGQGMALSELIPLGIDPDTKQPYGKFLRDPYNYARQVFMQRGQEFIVKKINNRLILIRRTPEQVASNWQG